ncbi:hypothetical protein FZ041_08125 [Selenomonas caprae]|uniref:Uncharacterized protein n=2 Tax=Selenomonas TaxID=970 RepID=A0A1I3DCX1_SELRU|nr:MULTISPECIES: hypothetical protein [Selenomonas]TYZ28411.1 hypothetical protein FZ041_08125 [Selenomonas caprae]SFH84398.1 hypothetical protein SAMN04487861_10610 [Selenomonas ruminantium]SFT32943.1 hypothetical protein SAMN02910356_00010 [Selenomonas ruminantium]
MPKSMPKFYNSLVQAWNTIFFAMLLVGGIYAFMSGHPVAGVLMVIAGGWGVWFCGKQVNYLMNTKAEDLPKTKLDEKLAEQTAKALEANMKKGE